MRLTEKRGTSVRTSGVPLAQPVVRCPLDMVFTMAITPLSRDGTLKLLHPKDLNQLGIHSSRGLCPPSATDCGGHGAVR